MQIYVKPLQQYLPEIKNINIINKNTLLYDYIDSEIIIVIDGGTSYLEALLANAKLILYIPQFTEKDIMQLKHLNTDPWYIEELYQFKKFPDKDFPHLLVARDLSTLEKHLNTIKTNPNYFETEEYLKDKNQYIKDSIGEYIPNVNKQLIDIIEKVEANN